MLAFSISIVMPILLYTNNPLILVSLMVSLADSVVRILSTILAKLVELECIGSSH